MANAVRIKFFWFCLCGLGVLVFTLPLKSMEYHGAKLVYGQISGEYLKVWKVSDLEWLGTQKNRQFQVFSQILAAASFESRASGVRHLGCFEGRPASVLKSFFNKEIILGNKKNSVSNFLGSVSFDDNVIGIDAKWNGKPFHFRLPSCQTKGLYFFRSVAGQWTELDKFKFDPSTITFEVISDGLSLPRDGGSATFLLRPPKVAAATPVSFRGAYTEKAALDLLVTLISPHFLNGKSPALSPSEGWCDLPWINETPTGRETVSGLATGLPLRSSKVFPNIRRPMPLWGRVIYNSIACGTIQKFFSGGTETFEKVQFPLGSVAIKFFFVKTEDPFFAAAWGQPIWVSDYLSNYRSLGSVQLMEIAVSMKSKYALEKSEGKNAWLYFNYYFDPAYRSSRDLPQPLDRMRPVGFQYFAGKGGSVVFPGAQTNNDHEELNGPADLLNSSCVSCHSTAGSKVSPKTLVGDQTKATGYSPMDYNLHLVHARRNFETRSRQ